MNAFLENQDHTVELRPYTKKELLQLYGIGYATLRKWLAPFDDFLGGKNKKMFNVNEVEFIFKTFGVPRTVKL